MLSGFELIGIIIKGGIALIITGIIIFLGLIFVTYLWGISFEAILNLFIVGILLLFCGIMYLFLKDLVEKG